MGLILAGGTVFRNGEFREMDVMLDKGRIVSVGEGLPREGCFTVQLNHQVIVPGFVDVHVHLREPGFSYKETIASGTAAGAAGGYTALCSMPNLDPVPDSPENLKVQLDRIKRDARIRVFPYGAITLGERGEELAQFEALAPYVAGFSDDGKGVQSRERMREAMIRAKHVDKPIVAHCEDETLLAKGWAVHEGKFAREHGLPGNDPASEWKQVARDLELVRETGCRYHVCHVSTKESVDLIRKAKAEGIPVTCETGPHYLILCEDDLEDDGRFRMNPPIRTAEDRVALQEGLLDGTIDCIATDHAPHSMEEKAKGLRGSLNGIVGLECAFPILYTYLAKPGIIPFDVLLNALTRNPRRIFGLPGGEIATGQIGDLAVLDLEGEYQIQSGTFRSMGRATPFDGWKVSAAVAMTVCGGEIVYQALGKEQV